MKNFEKIKERLRQAPKSFWIFLAIMVLGIFLRTYHFHTWLDFENDQSRDAILVSDVLSGKTAWPLVGPTMRGSQDAQANLFHLGPLYYYFQIISGEIFGNYPDKFAYPDLLFSILTIPLFYIFVKKYFSANLSLALAGLFAISFFAVEYSRFAWNPNSLPFFSLLFLLALYEFLTKGKKVSWQWAILAGVAIGVGVQLHIITLLLFIVTVFFVFAYLLKKDWRIWKKIAAVILVVFIFNSPQIYSELKTGFSNAKIFLTAAASRDSAVKSKSSLATKVGNNLNCHMENNAYILSSSGSSNCIFSYETVIRKMFHDKKVKQDWREIRQPKVAAGLILGFVFSFWGYVFLVICAWKEKDEKKKIFLRLIGLYVGLSFFIMLPIAEKFTEARYFIQVFFVPFLFLGFLADFLMRKFYQRAVPFVAILFVMLAFFNLKSLGAAAKDLRAGTKSDVHFAILGEMEKMVKYIADNADGQKEIYLVGDKPYRAHFFQPFWYLAEKEGVNIINVGENSPMVPRGSAIFYLTDKTRNGKTAEGGYEIESRRKFGKVSVYKLKGI